MTASNILTNNEGVRKYIWSWSQPDQTKWSVSTEGPCYPSLHQGGGVILLMSDLKFGVICYQLIIIVLSLYFQGP